MWDIRTYKKFRVIDWDGPKAIDAQVSELESNDKDDEEEKNASEEENKENYDPDKPAEEIYGYNKEHQAPFIYSAQFNNATNVIMAAGAGCNQVRLFDYESGNIICQISDLNNPILCMTKAN